MAFLRLAVGTVAFAIIAALAYTIVLQKERENEQPSVVQSTSAEYGDLVSLVRASDLIVVAEFTGEEKHPVSILSPDGQPTPTRRDDLLREYRVIQTIKGESDASLQVWNTERVEWSDRPWLTITYELLPAREGEVYVLFLRAMVRTNGAAELGTIWASPGEPAQATLNGERLQFQTTSGYKSARFGATLTELRSVSQELKDATPIPVPTVGPTPGFPKP